MRGEELSNLILVMFGVCIWDFATSLWFEYRLLTRKIRFRWQFVPYFLARYFVLIYATMNAVDVFIDSPSLSRCTEAVLLTSTIVIGVLGLVFSTWNLIIRTIIIWGHHPLIMKILFAAGSIHFVLATLVGSIGRSACTPVPPNVVTVAVFAVTTATIDLSILLLTVIGIRRTSKHRESALARLLMTQGAAYFVMAFLLQMVMIITRFARPNGIVNPCVGVFCSVLTPLLSCRLVTSTLCQNSHTDCDLEGRTHRIEGIELSEGQNQNSSSTRMTTHIEITKDQSVC